MILTSVLASVVFSFCLAATERGSGEGMPFVVSSQTHPEKEKVSTSLSKTESDAPDESPLTHRGRSDIEIEDDQPFGGYFYPKPLLPFKLPEFKTVMANAPFEGGSFFTEENAEVERFARSPRRRPVYFPPPPPLAPGFTPPNQIRPLPALYGRPIRF